MNAHELARQLLAGPDVEVTIEGWIDGVGTPDCVVHRGSDVLITDKPRPERREVAPW